MTSPVIQIEHLVKTYGRGGTAKTALSGLELSVAAGEVFGYLGPNGAGKSTTIRILLDLLRPTSGEVRLLGRSPRGAATLRGEVGYLAGDFIVNGRQTGQELLTYLGHLRGGVPAARIQELAKRLDLDLSRRIASLSKGNRQKVGVVQAFMHRPKLLILDEPTSGLDPFLQQQFVLMVQEARGEGQTVFMSSHVMSEVQQTCDRVGILRDGKLAAVGRLKELQDHAYRSVQLRFAAPVSPDDFADLPGVSSLTIEDKLLRCRVKGSPDSLLKAAAKHTILDLLSEEPDLETLFFQYYARTSSTPEVS